MKKFATVLMCLATLAFAVAPAYAALCFNCGSGSSNSCNQCRSRSGKDTFPDRKVCRDMGCVITGSSSCSTASNVKVCRAQTPQKTRAAVSQYMCMM